MNTQTLIEPLVNSIRARRSSLDALAKELRTPAILEAFDKWDHNSWCRSVAGDALVRLRLFTEQNFNVVETMGVVVVARYTFELAVWLRLFALDRRYGLVYFDQLLATQKRFYEDTLAQLQREVTWLKSLGQKETTSHDNLLKGYDAVGANAGNAQKLVSALSGVSAEIDAEAARRFSLYAEAARTNGYDFQAYLVETKALPPVRQALADIAAERDRFESRVVPEIKALRPDRWQWRQMAQMVGRADEYDYLYSFASKLLHATPVSITTDQKNLEVQEMALFLKYIDITIADVLALAKEYRPNAAAG
ncbi:hypothetical protein L6Q96_21425 [Candidatus Binatia bacterium]|nr:hypothetical protein [Candidatus Binatia bacterium]